MKQKKYGKSGWFYESDRHRLARLGIKTGRANYSKRSIPLSSLSANRALDIQKRLVDNNDLFGTMAFLLTPPLPFITYARRGSACKISYAKSSTAPLVGKIQAFLHKKFTLAVHKHPKNVQQNPMVIKARHDIENVNSWDKFKSWTKKHRNTILFIGLGGLLGAVGAGGAGTLMMSPTGEIVAVGRTLVGQAGIIGSTVFTGAGVLSEAKVIQHDVETKFPKELPKEFNVKEDVLVFHLKKQPNYASVYQDRDYGDLSKLSSPPIPFSDLSEKEQQTLNTAVSKAKKLFAKKGKKINLTSKNFQVVKRVGPDDSAFGGHQGDLIQIDRDTLKSQDKTEGVIAHELIHKLYDVTDETRDLENLQIDYMGLAM